MENGSGNEGCWRVEVSKYRITGTGRNWEGNGSVEEIKLKPFFVPGMTNGKFSREKLMSFKFYVFTLYVHRM